MTLNNRPIVFVANSSWYLAHYRNGLIKKCSLDNKVITLSPIDQSTEYLSKISTHIVWKIYRKKSANPLAFIISLIRMFFLLKAIKPRLIHSHTLKANFVVSICAAFFGIPCILSFAGLGNLNIGLKKIFLEIILKFIHIVGDLDRSGPLNIKINHKRTKYIFQNSKDKKIFEKICKPYKNKLLLIPGSGVPDEFLQKINKEELNKEKSYFIKNRKIKGLIYCGRLLKSKGIELFINIAKLDPSREYIVFGGIDNSSADSLTLEDIDSYKKIKNLNFKGYVKSPLLDFYSKSYVLVIPSIYGEGLPRAIAEALLLKIPVLSSRNALCETFSNEMLYIANSRDPKLYLETINLIEKEIDTNEFSNKLEFGRNYVLKNLTEERIIIDTLKVYQIIDAEKKEIYLNKDYQINSKNWISN